MICLASEPTDGVKTVLLEFRIHTACSTLLSHSGTRKSKISHLHYLSDTDKSSSPILKERLFGLSNPQGVHGESIKECHFHLDNTPSVSLSNIQCLCINTDDMILARVHEISLQIPSRRISLRKSSA